MSGDGGAPMSDWHRGEVGELRWREVEQLGCLEGAERHWGGGPMASRVRRSWEKEWRRRCRRISLARAVYSLQLDRIGERRGPGDRFDQEEMKPAARRRSAAGRRSWHAGEPAGRRGVDSWRQQG